MESANPNALPAGTVLHGNNVYTIERVLGAGGFGITYLASTVVRQGNLSFKGEVAIKEHFMSDHCERQPGSTHIKIEGTAKIKDLVASSRKDFLSEARRLSALGSGHNNIVHVNEVFEANGTAYYVMEYLGGQSLDDYLQANGPLGADALRAVMMPIVEATAFLHANHLTHLDIKPANIMLVQGDDGTTRPVLIDFGLSKHYDEHGNATSTVNTMGASDGYAPIEQYSGIRTFSPTADVYALGATMLACATGRRPSISSGWMPGEPQATIAALSVDNSLKAAIAKAMDNSVHNRYPDAGAMLAALGGGGGGTHIFHFDYKVEPQSPPTETLSDRKPRRFAPLIWGAIGAIIVVAAAAVALFLTNRDPGAEKPMPPAITIDSAVIAQATEQPASTETESQAALLGQQRLEEQRLEQQRIEQERLEQERIERERIEQERLERERVERQRLEQERLERERIEKETPFTDAWWGERRTPRNLYLAVNHNGRQHYLSEADYNSLTASQKRDLNKLGVVLIGTDGNGRQQRFIVALNDLTSELLDWNTAMSRYGNRLPNRDRGHVWEKQADALKRAVNNFGGSWPNYPYLWCWTSTELDSSLAWGVSMYGGTVINYSKTETGRVRAIVAVQDS